MSLTVFDKDRPGISRFLEPISQSDGENLDQNLNRGQAYLDSRNLEMSFIPGDIEQILRKQDSRTSAGEFERLVQNMNFGPKDDLHNASVTRRHAGKRLEFKNDQSPDARFQNLMQYFDQNWSSSRGRRVENLPVTAILDHAKRIENGVEPGSTGLLIEP